MLTYLYLILVLFFNISQSIKPHITALNKYSSNKKSIYISPGGLKGFYMLGVISYIKNNYDVSEYQIIGTSAGAWNTIPLALDNEEFNTEFLDSMFNYFDEIVDKNEKVSLYNIQCNMKKICENCKNIEYSKINIVSNNLSFRGFHAVLINNFSTMEDLTKYCIASSHIPFLTGNIFCRVDGKLYFDGGIFKEKVKTTTRPYFCIESSMWNYDFGELNLDPFNKNHLHHYKTIYNQGFADSCENKKELDKYFSSFDKNK